MRNLRLISTTAAILLLSAGAVSAQNMKTDETPAAAPAVQQNALAEKVAPTLNSDQRKAPETMGQAAPAAPEADKKQLNSKTMDNAPAGASTKGSSDANGSANVKNKNSAAESGVGASSSSRKSADEGKRSTTGQGAVNEDAVGGPKLVKHRHYRHYHHYRHYRDCWPNIFDHGNCW
jgi:hypothetical protein